MVEEWPSRAEKILTSTAVLNHPVLDTSGRTSDDDPHDRGCADQALPAPMADELATSLLGVPFGLRVRSGGHNLRRQVGEHTGCDREQLPDIHVPPVAATCPGV